MPKNTMHPHYRKELLALMARIEQEVAEAEALTVEVTDDEILLRASKQRAELRRVLSQIEEKLQRTN